MITNDKDSVRSRVAAGICYVAVGGVICTVVLLLMRSDASNIPYGHNRGPIPLEFVAGVAGIVVFMGVVQLLIAFVRKMRGRQ
jgi:hypothetical protein